MHPERSTSPQMRLLRTSKVVDLVEQFGSDISEDEDSVCDSEEVAATMDEGRCLMG